MNDFEDRAGNVDVEALSAYLDGELNDTERARVEARLAADPAWRAELDSLRWTVNLLSQLPEAPLPRSFELPVTEAAPARPQSEPRSQPFWQNLSWIYGFMRLATAVSMALLLGVVVFDVWQTGTASRTAAPMVASAPASAPDNAAEAKRQAEAPAAQPAPPRAAQAPMAPPTAFAPSAADQPGRGGAGGSGGLGGGGAGDPPSSVGLGAAANQEQGAPIVEAVPSPMPAPAQAPAPLAAVETGPPLAQPGVGMTLRGWQVALGVLVIGLAVATWMVRKRLKTRD